MYSVIFFSTNYFKYLSNTWMKNYMKHKASQKHRRLEKKKTTLYIAFASIVLLFTRYVHYNIIMNMSEFNAHRLLSV